jgi:hypothetical protein
MSKVLTYFIRVLLFPKKKRWRMERAAFNVEEVLLYTEFLFSQKSSVFLYWECRCKILKKVTAKDLFKNSFLS